MIYLDANLFIIAAFGKDKKGERAREIIRKVSHGQPAITSVLALDEVMWVLYRNKEPQTIKTMLTEIYAIRNLEVREAPQVCPLRAIDYIENYHLKPRDAMHLAIMEEFGIDSIASDDCDFDGIPGIKRLKI